MNIDSVDIVIHPVRFRILQTLLAGEQSTKEIAGHLKDVAASSLYRHIKILLVAGYIDVAEIRLVQGIQEKVYMLARSPRIGPDDLSEATAEEHLRYFTIYVITLLRGFSDYLDASPNLDFLADFTGYTETVIWASPEELEEFASSLNQSLSPLLDNKVTSQRTKHKIAIITHPI